MSGQGVFEVEYKVNRPYSEVTDLIKKTCEKAREKAQAAGGKICYAFKILGEPKIILVSEGAIEEVFEDLYKAGLSIVKVQCKPVYSYKAFAENILGVDKSLTAPLGEGISDGEGPWMWMCAHIIFTAVLQYVDPIGADPNELRELWKREALAFIESKKKGQKNVAYKAASQHVIYGCTKVTSEQADKAMQDFPMFNEKQEHVRVETTVQYVAFL